MAAQVKSLPMLFECYECERTHPLVEGGYVFTVNEDGSQKPLRETKFFCITCAKATYGEETVNRVLVGAFLADKPAK